MDKDLSENQTIANVTCSSSRDGDGGGRGGHYSLRRFERQEEDEGSQRGEQQKKKKKKKRRANYCFLLGSPHRKTLSRADHFLLQLREAWCV